MRVCLVLYCDVLCCFPRALLHRPNRRVVRKKAGTRQRTSSHHTADVAFHPQLSMAHGKPLCMCLCMCVRVHVGVCVTWHKAVHDDQLKRVLNIRLASQTVSSIYMPMLLLSCDQVSIWARWNLILLYYTCVCLFRTALSYPSGLCTQAGPVRALLCSTPPS